MARTSSIKREKEGWPGVLLTAIGCIAFLAWWFWPREGGDSLEGVRQTTPQELLAAAIEGKRTAASRGALDADILVLALTAATTGQDALLQQAKEAIEDDALQDLATRISTWQAEKSFTGIETESPLNALLEQGDIDASLDWARTQSDNEKFNALIDVAAMLTQLGEIDHARIIVSESMDTAPSDSTSSKIRLASLYAQWDELESATVLLNSAAASASAVDEQLAVAGQYYLHNLFDEGEALMMKSAESAQGDSAMVRKVAVAYLELGQVEQAENIIRNSADGGDALLKLKLALARWGDDAFLQALSHWRNLEGDAEKTEATDVIREHFRGQLAAGEAPALIWKPHADDGANNEEHFRALRESVDTDDVETAAREIAAMSNPIERARSYLVLARLVLWRYTRSSPTGI